MSTTMTRMEDHEVVSVYPFSEAQIDRLMTDAKECVLMWGTKDGWAVGVYHSFVWKDGKIWLTFAAHRHRAAAMRRDPRCSIAVSGVAGQSPDCPQGSITVKGRAEFHEDAETKDWFYRALAHKAYSDDLQGEENFVLRLDSPLRVIVEVTPEKWITFDSEKSSRHLEGTLPEEDQGPRLESDRERTNIERTKRGLDPR